MPLRPLSHKKIIRKRTKKFTKFEVDDYPAGRLTRAWRRPRGIDNRMRRRFRGNKPNVRIGYGSDRDSRHRLPSGFRKLLIRTPAELEILLMNNRSYAAEVASNISARKKAQIVRRAAELNVVVTNGRG